IVSGIIQQGRDPRMVLVDLGEVEAVLPPHERVPGEDYSHGRRLRAYVTEARRGAKGPQITLSRSQPNLVPPPLDPEAPEAADRTNALSPSRVTSVTVLDEVGRSARAVVPETQLSLAIGKDGQNARLAAKLTGWKIDIRPDGSEERAPAD